MLPDLFLGVCCFPQVSLSWSSDTARPGDLVSLTVRVLEPRSLVALLVVGMDDDHPVFDQDFREEKVNETRRCRGNWMHPFSVHKLQAD